MSVRTRNGVIWGVSILSLAVMASARAQQVTSSTTEPSPSTVAVPSGDTYYCEKCGTFHTRTGSISQSAVGTASTIVQTSASSLATSGGTSNVLSALNAQRARQGLGSLAMDPQLQAVAERRAQLMASSGTKSHPPGSYAPGRYEGVGWSSSYSPSGVSACFTSDPRMRVAGAAMATGRDGVYFCVVYR
jgi:uncharacterized protein YkwD